MDKFNTILLNGYSGTSNSLNIIIALLPPAHALWTPLTDESVLVKRKVIIVYPTNSTVFQDAINCCAVIYYTIMPTDNYVHMRVYASYVVRMCNDALNQDLTSNFFPVSRIPNPTQNVEFLW